MNAEVRSPSDDVVSVDAKDVPAQVAVHARGLQLQGSRGAVYGPLELDLPTGGLVVLQGPQGGGRSSLLLTLAGRMVPDGGSQLTVLGESLPRHRRAVQRRAAKGWGLFPSSHSRSAEVACRWRDAPLVIRVFHVHRIVIR